MAWDIQDRFPTWGEAGEFPADGFFYEGGDQVNEKHLDALWNGLKNREDELQSALLDIDSDKDGIVDKADSGASGFIFDDGATLNGDLTDGANIIFDQSESHIPLSILEASTTTVTAGDGLKGGGTVTLGGSTTINIEPADFAGAHLSDDGSDNLAVDDDFVLNSGDSMSGNLTMGSNDVREVNILTFADRDGDGNNWRVVEGGADGRLKWESVNGGGTQADLEHNGNLRIEGELTEGAAL